MIMTDEASPPFSRLPDLRVVASRSQTAVPTISTLTAAASHHILSRFGPTVFAIASSDSYVSCHACGGYLEPGPRGFHAVIFPPLRNALC